MKKRWEAYCQHVDSQLHAYEVFFTVKEFLTMKAITGGIGLLIGFILAAIQYDTYGFLFQSTVIGVGVTVIGYLIPHVYIYYLHKENNAGLSPEQEQVLNETLVRLKEKTEKEEDGLSVLQLLEEKKNQTNEHQQRNA